MARRFPSEVIEAFLRKVDAIADFVDEKDIYVQSGNDYKPADWFLPGSFSIRLNRQFRLILFREEDGGIRIIAFDRIVDYH
ncbi:hypothetical protein BH11ARM2_BH11ARM2_28380 [soil metagenome]